MYWLHGANAAANSSEETAMVHKTHPAISLADAVSADFTARLPSSRPTSVCDLFLSDADCICGPIQLNGASHTIRDRIYLRTLQMHRQKAQLEVNGELSMKASDVTTQFLAELHLYMTIGRHRNTVGFLGCLEGMGMVLEFVDRRTLLDVMQARPELTRELKIDFHNQLLDGLSHLHAHGLSHGDLLFLNVHVTKTDTIKILDFGQSVAADLTFAAPDTAPADPFAFFARTKTSGRLYLLHIGAGTKRRKVEQIHRGTRPFTAPEVLHGECEDAYSFGVILVCLDQCTLVDCDPEVQMRDAIPEHFLDGCQVSIILLPV